MEPIRLAVIFNQQISSGGGYQQALNSALVTKKLSKQTAKTFFFTTLKQNITTLASHGINAELIQLSFFQKVRTFLYRLVREALGSRVLKCFGQHSHFERTLIEREIDLVYFLGPCNWANDLSKINYVTTVWDLCHRDDPEFPEVRWKRQFEMRESLYRSLLPRAAAIFVDSELGKKNVVHRYCIDYERVYVMPFQAATTIRRSSASDSRPSIDVHEKYCLAVPYVFYPAQFWAHKNHVYVLEGLRALEDRYGLVVGAIFSGGDQGNLGYVHSYARRKNLKDRVRFIGFVDNEEIPELYRQALALTMPSYFGPTNLPPIEGFELGVPVLYSDKAGLREQVGEAALLMDLRDPNSMAEHLKHLIEDPGLRVRLIEAGKERLEYFEAIDRSEILNRVIEDFRWKRLTWQ